MKEIPEIHIYKEISIRELSELISRKIFSELMIPIAVASTGGSGGINPDETEGDSDNATITNNASSTSTPEDTEETVKMDLKFGPALTAIKKAISAGINNPTSRIVLTGMMAAYAELMVKKTKENITVSQARVDSLNETMESYRAGGGSGYSLCTESDRDNKAKPECYCYNSDSSVNTMRSQRPECVSYINGTSKLVAYDYNNIGKDGYNSSKACITADKKFDPDCSSCKKNKNLCNFINKGLGKLSLGKSKWARGVANLLNKFNTGSLGGAAFKYKALQASAIRAQGIRDAQLDKNPDVKKKTNKAIKRLIASNENAFKKLTSSNPSLLKSMDSETSSLGLKAFKDPKKNEVMANVRAKFLKAGNAKVSKGGNAGFDLGLGDSAGSLLEEDFAMNDEFKITGDINTNSNQNIFKILSNRYQRSGLRRLFDVDNKSQADEATGLEINEQ